MAEVKTINGMYYRREGDKGIPISQQEYTQHMQTNAMQGSKSTDLVDQLLTGFSKGGQDIMDAGIDAYGRMTGDESLVQGLEQLSAGEQAVYDRSDPALLMHGGEIAAQMLPYVGAGAAASGVAGAGLASQMGAQGVAAGLTNMATTSGSFPERVGGALEEATWAAGGAGAGAAIERIFNRVRGARMGHTQTQREAAKAMDAGMQLSPGQASGNRMLQRTVEPWVESMGGFAKARDINEELYQGVVGKALGQADDAIDLSATGLGQAADDIGQGFDVLKGLEIKLTPEQGQTLTELGNLSEYFDFPKNRNFMSGNEFKRIRRQISELGKRARINPAAPAGQAEELEKFRKTLDLKFSQQAGPTVAKQFKQAREKWKILETIERGAALSPDGVINPNSMRSAVNSMWGKTLRRNKMGGVEPETRAWLEQVNAQASKGTKSMVGSSGTAERSGASLMGALTTHGAAGAAGAGTYGIMAEDPTMPGYVAAGLAGSAGFNQLLRNYGRMGNLMGQPGRTGQLLGPIGAGLMVDEE